MDGIKKERLLTALDLNASKESEPEDVQLDVEAAREQAFEEACQAVCDYCRLDGKPEDMISKSTATPAGDDGGPRFLHRDEDGDDECMAEEIRVAMAKSLLRRVSGKGAQSRCWKCEAKIPHEWQFCELGPAPLPATPAFVTVKREDLESISRKGHNGVCPVCRNNKHDGHKTTCWLSNALIGRATTQGTPEGAK